LLVCFQFFSAIIKQLIIFVESNKNVQISLNIV